MGLLGVCGGGGVTIQMLYVTEGHISIYARMCMYGFIEAEVLSMEPHYPK